MLPYRVLAVYKPRIWNARQIGHELAELTYNAGFRPHVDPNHGPLLMHGKSWHSVALHAEVRRRTAKSTQGEGWHYDGDLPDFRTGKMGNPNCLIALWASNTPTLIKWKNSNEIYQASPYEVVVFNNMQCVHRRPANCPRMRWVFRQRLAPKELT